jgi:hypothetical protein
MERQGDPAGTELGFSVGQIKNEFRQTGGVSASCPFSALFDARKALEKPLKEQ